MKTSLNGHEFIEKTHLRIELRGLLDELNARIILTQVNSDDEIFINDLEEIRIFVLRLIKCEVNESDFGDFILWGMNDTEIHQRSHNPEKFYGIGHIMPHFEMGKKAAEINFLRTMVRKVEISAFKTFGDSKKDFTNVLNRLSSALYILTYKYLPKNYNKTIKFNT